VIRRRLNFLLFQNMPEDRAGEKGNNTQGCCNFFIYGKTEMAELKRG